MALTAENLKDHIIDIFFLLLNVYPILHTKESMRNMSCNILEQRSLKYNQLKPPSMDENVKSFI